MIVKELASDYIVEGQVGCLKNLLETLSEDSIAEQIENWEIEGSVYLSYFNAQLLINELKDKIEVTFLESSLSIQLTLFSFVFSE